jgi:hypothetical protein
MLKFLIWSPWSKMAGKNWRLRCCVSDLVIQANVHEAGWDSGSQPPASRHAPWWARRGCSKGLSSRLQSSREASICLGQSETAGCFHKNDAVEARWGCCEITNLSPGQKLPVQGLFNVMRRTTRTHAHRQITRVMGTRPWDGFSWSTQNFSTQSEKSIPQNCKKKMSPCFL